MRLNIYLYEQKGCSEAGKLEVGKMNLEDARKFAEKKGLDVDKEIPGFDKAFQKAQGVFKTGRTKRMVMPVIDDSDIDKFKSRLE